MALLEAQVCGLPLVSYACKCGPRDIIENGKNGYLINEGNVKEFSTKLIRLMERSDLRKEMGVASKRKSENFTEETIMKEWLGLFSDLLNTKI
jgi:glycosyltransferase involved in cell wall biosynthesis